MARRATSLTKGRAATQGPAPVEIAQPMAHKPLRRAQKAKSNDMPPTDMSMTDAFFPGGDESTSSVADTKSPSPAKSRRGRKPKELSTSVGERGKATSAPAQSVASTDGDKRAAQSDAPSSVEVADAASSSAAARWNAETGTATFDWPVIEAVAAIGGANQAMAKLLLAARAEGANSRWPTQRDRHLQGIEDQGRMS